MDFLTLTTFLAPFLPALINLGSKAAESAAEKFGEDAWEKAKSIWSKLNPKLESKPMAQGAAQELAENPEDEDAREVLAKQLKKLLESDPTLMADISQLFNEKSETVQKVVTISQQWTGDRNIVIGQVDGTISIQQD